MVVFAGLEPGLSGGKELVTPLGEACGRDAELAAECIEGLAPKDAEDDLGLATAGPSSLVLSAGRSCGRAAPSLRIDQPVAVLLGHGRHCRRDSQMGVSGNRAPDQTRLDVAESRRLTPLHALILS